MIKATATSPKTKVFGDKKMRLTRRFLGNINGKSTFEKNELKAYTKGHSLFSFGRDERGHQAYHRVRQEYFYI